MENNERYDPVQALADAAEARSSALALGTSPRGFYLAHGVAVALLILGLGLPSPWSLITLGLAVAGLGILVRWYRQVTGVWVTFTSTDSAARRVWAAYAVLLIATVLTALAAAAASERWLIGSLAAVGLIASPITGHFLEPLLTQPEAHR